MTKSDHICLAAVFNCFHDVECWMARNFLKLDDSKFSVRASRLWNDLPEDIRLAESVTLLKSHFYGLLSI